jgi:hypothetical protein
MCGRVGECLLSDAKQRQAPGVANPASVILHVELDLQLRVSLAESDD